MIARDDQSSFVAPIFDLNSDPGASGIPTPGWVFDRGSNVRWCRPGLTIIFTLQKANRAFGQHLFSRDLFFIGRSRVMGSQQPNDSRLLIHDGARISARVRSIIPEHLLLAPGPSGVIGSLNQ